MKSERVGVYIPLALLAEMKAEAERLDRPLTYLMRVVWKLAREKIQAFPGEML